MTRNKAKEKRREKTAPFGVNLMRSKVKPKTLTAADEVEQVDIANGLIQQLHLCVKRLFACHQGGVQSKTL